MPKIMRLDNGYWVVFFSSDGTEPIHVHVIRGSDYSRSSKFWILRNGYIDIQTNGLGLDSREINSIAGQLASASRFIMNEWYKMFGHIEFYE